MKKQKFLKRILSTFIAAALAAMCCVSAFASTTIVNGWEYEKKGTGSAVICGADMTELVFPDSIFERKITAVDEYAFINRTDITLLDFSNAESLSTIGRMAFSGCTGITELTLTSSVTSVGEYAFYGCTGLETLNFNSTALETIPMACFYGCSALTEVVIPDCVTTIGEMAFTDCTALESVTIPASVTSIADDAFLRDFNLVISCYEGSYAQTYAEENDIDYVLITEQPTDPTDSTDPSDTTDPTDSTDPSDTADPTVSKYARGDVDRSGVIDISDATLVQKYVAKIVDLDDEQKLLADSDKSGIVDISDATAIQKHVAKIALLED